MNAVIWLPDARDDLERLHAFIRPHSRTAAQRAITAVIDAVEQLCEFPEMGRPFDYDLDYHIGHILRTQPFQIYVTIVCSIIVNYNIFF